MRSLWLHRRLMASMVRRDLAARYRGSVGGALWTLLNPLLLMATYYFVFGVVLGTHRSALSLLAGMIPWLAFSEAVGRSPQVILEYRGFVKKLMFPLETLPVNLVISAVVTELIFVMGWLIARGQIPSAIVWLPLLLVPQLLFTVGLCWFLAATGVFLRDLGHVIGFILTLWFFLTPICYSDASVPPAAARLLAWNPVGWLVEGYRAMLIENRRPHVGALLLLGLAAAVLGYAWFRRLRSGFADVL